MPGKYWVTSREVLVRALRDTCVHNKYEEDSCKHYTIEYKDFFIPLEVCIERPYVDWDMVRYYLHAKGIL